MDTGAGDPDPAGSQLTMDTVVFRAAFKLINISFLFAPRQGAISGTTAAC